MLVLSLPPLKYARFDFIIIILCYYYFINITTCIVVTVNLFSLSNFIKSRVIVYNGRWYYRHPIITNIMKLSAYTFTFNGLLKQKKKSLIILFNRKSFCLCIQSVHLLDCHMACMDCTNAKTYLNRIHQDKILGY